jgi:tetratricopeptide (TPR) repeat protein
MKPALHPTQKLLARLCRSGPAYSQATHTFFSALFASLRFYCPSERVCQSPSGPKRLSRHEPTLDTLHALRLACGFAALCRGLVLAFVLWPLAACPEALFQSNHFQPLLSPLWPGALSARFEAANKLYEEGKYAEAAASYERLLQGGQVSAALCFNLGNAAFKSSQIGRAIAAYRHAERLAPRDPDVRANLQFARNQVQGPTLPVGRWQRWLNRFTLDEWTVMAAAALWLLFLLLALLQWRPALKASLRRAVLAAAAGAVLLAACLAAALCQARSVRIAIVVKPEAVVRAGWFDESKEAFTVHDGAELKVLDQNDKWLQVGADPLRLGWIPRAEVVLER